MRINRARRAALAAAAIAAGTAATAGATKVEILELTARPLRVEEAIRVRELAYWCGGERQDRTESVCYLRERPGGHSAWWALIEGVDGDRYVCATADERTAALGALAASIVERPDDLVRLCLDRDTRAPSGWRVRQAATRTQVSRAIASMLERQGRAIVLDGDEGPP